MTAQDFQPGDHVVIREWDDMEAEFGLDGRSGSISCQFKFTDRMKKLCGKHFVIASIDEIDRIWFEDHANNSLTSPFYFSADMIRLEHEPVEIDIDENSFLSLIF